MILASISTLPASVEDTDDDFWQNFRDDARDLASALPEFARFVSAEATDESLIAWRETVERASARLTAREASLRKQQENRRATAADANLVPGSPHMRLLIRYASMNDRRIEKLLKLVDEHCGQPTENDT